MPRSFVVVRKTIAIVADFNCRFIELEKLGGSRRPGAIKRARRARSTFSKNRIERVLGENVLDVGDEQFLMLLLVMNSESENRFDLAK